ncbi:hypothetical protein B296_00038683 [Ensete ventricosum]|uniref:Uncharacterized protein n=1 Tax=Ensete ventricosum TaxID=4639 RepID=A0A426YAA1_ENSVE|nr:hypothetical protein B296_00038683 [Ensete ventricosum]
MLFSTTIYRLPPPIPSLPRCLRLLHAHAGLRRPLTPLHRHGRNSSGPNNASSILTHPLLCLLPRCSTLHHLKQIQAQMVLSGLISDTLAASRLLASCLDPPHLSHAAIVLANLDNPDTFCWNIAVRGFADNGNLVASALLYKSMLRTNARPDNYTYPVLFKVCGRMLDQRLGIMIFGHALQLGFDTDVYVVNSSICMFAMSGRLAYARNLFDQSPVRDLVTWNTLINAYVQCGFPREALELLQEMEVKNIISDEVTMIGAVACSAQMEDLELGRKFHRNIEELGIERTVPLMNALIDMYVKCGSLEPARTLFDSLEKRSIVSWTTMIMGYAKFGYLDVARKLFDEMPEKDVVPWNALINGYVQCKRGWEAIALFHEMQASDMKPDEITMVGVLSACSQLGALEIGIWVHRYIKKHQLYFNVALGTALVDMYAKCGNIDKSLQVFRDIPERNSLTWTAIICGLASHGHATDAISLFLRMTSIRLQPDEITFLGVLSACCHAGLVDEGRMFFTQMTSKYNILPKLKHYSCMVDLLGRAGLLREAEELVMSMPIEPDAAVWGALFFACRIHGNVSMGEWAALQLIKLDPQDSGIYVLLANMYVESNMKDKADKVREMMRDIGLEKTPGCSSIEVNGVIHEFLVRDQTHEEQEKIYGCLMQLTKQMKKFVNLHTISIIDSS